MKMVIFKFGAALLASTILANAAQAQDDDDGQVEQGLIEDGAKLIGKLGKAAGCEAVKKVPFIGGRIARELGCDKIDEMPESETEVTNLGADDGVIPNGELRPSLTINFMKLTGQGNDIEAEAAGPDTVYEANSGFAMVVQNTAPGYLEIWSVDEDPAFIEGALLPQAGALVLPKSVQGLYRLDGRSQEDYVRFRFYPCEPQGEQGFDLEANQEAAQLTGNAVKAAARLSERLPACTFNTSQIENSIKAKVPQDSLFRAAFNQPARYDEGKAAYVIESNKVRPMDALIELKRQ